MARSMARLAGFDFEWALPGHGERVCLPRDEVRRQMAELVAGMRGGGRVSGDLRAVPDFTRPPGAAPAAG
jgi:hypothetical protein